MRHFIYLALSAILVLGTAALPSKADQTLTANQLVVIKATGVALEKGQIIDGSKILKLGKGASVTLIGNSGSTVTLTGPYEQAPAEMTGGNAQNPNIVKALGALISARKFSTASLGVVRSGSGETGNHRLSDPWLVSVEGSGPRCIRPGIVVLWRNDASKQSTVTISRSSASLTAQADWAAGDNVLPLASNRFRDGGDYTLELEKKRIALTVHVLPGEYTEVGQQAAWMAETGCTNQALALLDAVG